MLQLKDGENQELAGLIKNDERSSATHLPGLGDVPLIGRLFGSRQDTRDKTEVVLSITPHLVRNIQRPAANAAEFNAGTESSFRRRPDEPVRVPVQLPVPAGVPVRQQGAPAAPAGAPAAAAAPPAAQPAMVPATSVNMGGSPSAAPASSPATALPPTPGVQAVPLPRPDVTPLPAQR
jgi:general secretion pathway protein D